MADIFLSYCREDQATARRFAEGLGREGFTVWWDQSLNAGEDFDRVTEQALTDAKAVVVLWSKRSVDSRWVRAEATEAKANNRLVPAMIELCKRPIVFELTHAADLVDWKGDAQDPRWRSLVEGLRRMTSGGTATVPLVQAPPATPHRPWVALAIAVVAAVLLAGGIAWYFLDRARAPVQAVAAQLDAADASIAVLPFVNMSADPEQDYFSDGLSEELINQLAHIDGLRVTARTSAFSFKGKSEDLRAVGRALGVANILEGSVRKSGGRIRITVQLINSATGYHMWSETFDRAVDDVFAIQDEIAATVAGKVGPTLAGAPRTTDFGGTRSLEAYDHLLRGNSEWAKFSPDSLLAAIKEYRAALAIDPLYARASAELAIAMGARAAFEPDPTAFDREREQAIANAMKGAPNAPLSHVASMWLHSDRHEWIAADDACKAAFAIGRDPRAEGICGGFLTLTGRTRAAKPYRDAARESDPLSFTMAATVVRQFALLNMGAELRVAYDRLEGLTGSRWQADEAMLAYLADSRAPQDQIDAQLARACPTVQSAECAAWGAAIRTPRHGSVLLRTQLQSIRESKAGGRPGAASSIALAAASLGDTSLVLDALDLFTAKGSSPAFQNLWYPVLGKARADARFKEMVRRMGFVELWQHTGQWADACRPAGTDDFNCS